MINQNFGNLTLLIFLIFVRRFQENLQNLLTVLTICLVIPVTAIGSPGEGKNAERSDLQVNASLMKALLESIKPKVLFSNSAQRSISEHRAALNEFLIGPRHQLKAGYDFVPGAYDVDYIDEHGISGYIYVDIQLKQSWWNAYYSLVKTLKTQTNQIIHEGPLTVHDGVAGVNLSLSSPVDQSLQYDLAHPLPVRLSIGRNASNVILYKNALLVSAQPMTQDSAQSDYQRLQASRGEISMTSGNVVRSHVMVDVQKSALDCGSVRTSDSAVYCGRSITVKIPFEAGSEASVVKMIERGVRTELALYGDSCEFACERKAPTIPKPPERIKMIEQQMSEWWQGYSD